MPTLSSPPTTAHSDRDKWYRKLVKRWITRCGYQFTSVNRRLHLFDACRHLKQRGIHPRTVIDVGVAWGTQELYDAFPEARLLLVEPNPQWKSSIDRTLKQRLGDAAMVALGDTEGSITLHVWRGSEGSSSVLRSKVGRNAHVIPIEVPLRRLDQIVESVKCEPPFLVKIDVQGAEAGVLRGMTGILARTEAIIVETSLLAGQGAPAFRDMVHLFEECGWSLYDVVGFNYRPRDQALAQVDAVFVPDVGTARDSMEWA